MIETAVKTLKNRIVDHGEEAPDQLLANPRNWRVHPKDQQDALEGVLQQVGWVQDVVVNRQTGHLVDGHLRVSLALRRKEPTVPVVYVDLTPEEEALVLASMDPVSAMATVDKEKLDALLHEVQTTDAGVQKMLSDLAEAEGLYFGKDGKPAVEDVEPQIDRAGELKKKWGTEMGQLWALGDHRLICGDCTDQAVVTKCLDGVVPLLCVTDPPYGIEYNADWRNHASRADGSPIGGGAIGTVHNDDRADWRDAWAHFPGDVIYSWHPAGAPSLVHAAALQDSGFKIRAQIIWAKNHFPIGRGDYHVKHEPCWYCVREGRTAHFTDDRTQTTLWDIDKPHKSETGHSTQKPIECMARPIRNHDSEYVYEPFSDSGTTIIACEQLGRKCRAVEISPAYVAVALERWAEATGGTPELVQ